MQIITYKGKMHIFNETSTDLAYPEEWFISRCWFIVKNMNLFKNNMSKLDALSHLWISVQYLKAVYDDATMSDLSKCSSA